MGASRNHQNIATEHQNVDRVKPWAGSQNLPRSIGCNQTQSREPVTCSDPSLPLNTFQPSRSSLSPYNLSDTPTASVDWSRFSRPQQAFSAITEPIPPHMIPFILDTGATCHISPVRSDFISLTPTPPRAVKGLGGTHVFAQGIGPVRLCVSQERTLTVENVLFIPNSMIRLLSVVLLNRSGNYTSHFSPYHCWITNNTNNDVVAMGLTSKYSDLYEIIPDSFPPSGGGNQSPSAFQSSPPIPTQSNSSLPSAHYMTRMPNIETWHRRLGHCNIKTIVEMAQSRAVNGMTIDLSEIPPKCDSCILGKQTISTIPKVREGPKATDRLEHIHVDLSGPMTVTSRSGRKYSMNIMDDYSSYVWSVPLRLKSEAVPVIQAWQQTVENQSDKRLKSLISDGGELDANVMAEWCLNRGLIHQMTAPYTSLQNGRAERLHHTIMNKARSMRLTRCGEWCGVTRVLQSVQ